MSQVQRTAGVAGTFSYTLSVVPFAAPVMTIYSDAARTVQAVAPAALAATANPSVFTASYPASLAVGTYYLKFSTAVTNGQPAWIDSDDELILVSASGSVVTSYASVQDVRNLPGGVTVAQRSDLLLQDDLDVASRIVDDFTGSQFYQTQGTVTVYDVRLPLVVLPRPFSAITAVSVDGRAVDAAGYTVTPSGLRLYINPYIDVDGFPRKVFANVGAQRNPYGQNVAVTATFGYATVPAPVRRATALLASRLALGSVQNMIPDSRIASITVEGYSRTFKDDDRVATTGDSEVDRLLSPYSRRSVLVG